MVVMLIRDELIWCLLGKLEKIPAKQKNSGAYEAIYPSGKEKTAQKRTVLISKNQYTVHSKHFK